MPDTAARAACPRHHQPEGRRRQDHHRDQPRHRAGRARPPGAGDRPRPAGQRLDRPRHRGRGPRLHRLRPAVRRRPASARRPTRPWCRACGHPGDPGPELRRRRYGVRHPAAPQDAAGACARDRAEVREQDYILIDCPPSLNLLTINALVAADSVLVPLQCEFFALEGLSQLMRTVQTVRASSNPELKIQGIVLTMYDRRNNLSGQVAADVRENLGTLVYDTVIPRNVRLSEAPSHAMPALIYDRTSSGSLAYQRLAGELLARMQRARDRGRDGLSGGRRMERKGLGRGLSALLADVAVDEAAPRRGAPAAPRRPTRVPIERIRPNPNQPRRDFDEKELAGPRRLDPREGRDPAADPAPAPGRAGQLRDRRRRAPLARGAARRASTSCRRWCASSTDAEVLELAIIENIQRADLNAARGGAGLPPADGPLRPHPGAARRGARQEPQPHRQPAAPADPARAGARAAARPAS